MIYQHRYATGSWKFSSSQMSQCVHFSESIMTSWHGIFMMTSSNGNIFRVTVPVNSPHKGQWRGALMFSLICVRINGWVNNREAGDLRRYRAHYDVTAMFQHSDGNPSLNGGWPHKGPGIRNFDVFFCISLEDMLNDQSRCRGFLTPWWGRDVTVTFSWDSRSDIKQGNAREMSRLSSLYRRLILFAFIILICLPIWGLHFRVGTDGNHMSFIVSSAFKSLMSHDINSRVSGLLNQFSSTESLKDLSEGNTSPRKETSHLSSSSSTYMKEHCVKLTQGTANSTLLKWVARQHPPKEMEYLKSVFMSCDDFLRVSDYIQEPLNFQEESFPIAYSIVVYKDPAQVERLLHAIYRPQNHYCIHVDSKVSKRDSRSDARLCEISEAILIDVVWVHKC